jgi:hypothetical protein
MLHEFLTAHRNELIARCRVKVARRLPPSDTIPTVVAHGVPLFLQQLVDTLRREETKRDTSYPEASPAPTAIGRAAALHGAEMLRIGYTVDQVVHDYGDVCQAVTELAIEKHATIATEEFRTLNRCLDNAIADAVTAYGKGRDTSSIDQAFDQAEALHGRIGSLAEEQRRLIEMAIQAFSAIKTGNVGMIGATSTVLGNALLELRALVEQTMPEIRLAAGMTTPPPDAKLKKAK